VRFVRFVVPVGDGTYDVDLPPALRDMIRTTVGQVREMVVVGDPALARLFPPAHPGDDELEAEWRQMMAGQLIEARLASFDVVDETLDAEVLDEAQLEAWMQGINAVRLVLGTIVGVTDGTEEDGPPEPAPADTPRLAALEQAYHVLSLVLEDLVDAAASGLDG